MTTGAESQLELVAGGLSRARGFDSESAKTGWVEGFEDYNADENFIVGRGMDYTPGLHLIFEGGWYTPDPGLPDALRDTSTGHWEPVRAAEAGVVLTAIEEIYLASIRADLAPPDYATHVDWAVEANARSSTLRMRGLGMGSPLHVLLESPPMYVATFAAFAYGLAHVFGVPYRALTMFERARESFFEQRVATAAAKDAWLDYKAERIARQTSLQLRAVDPLRSNQEPSDEVPIQPSDES